MGTEQVRLQREKLELSPVYSTAMVHEGHKLGYIRLVNFSQHAAADMQKAVTQLEVLTSSSLSGPGNANFLYPAAGLSPCLPIRNLCASCGAHNAKCVASISQPAFSVKSLEAHNRRRIYL